MSRADQWMPLYVGDYLADTGHLSTLEHGAYLLTILHYWRTGPLPNDDRALARIMRLHPSEAAEVVEALRPMFREDGDVLRHKRIDAERAKADEISIKRQAAGKAGAEARYCKSEASASQTDGNCLANAMVLPEQTHRQSQSHIQEQDTEREKEEISLTSNNVITGVSFADGRRRARIDDPDDFAEFWAAYPRPVAKGHARKAWAAATRKASAADIIDALHSARWNPNPKYIPHPATWLNGEGWLDRTDNRDPVMIAAEEATRRLRLSEVENG